MNEKPIATRNLLPWVVAAATAWCLGFAYNVHGGGELSWLRKMYWDKIAIANKTEVSPRLLVTGGSGAHYTIDSGELEQQLGMPVINLGLDGPVGLDVILPSVIEQVKPGDVVLLIPEYLLLLDNDGFGDRSTSFGIAINQPGLGDIPTKQFLQDAISLGIPSLRSLAKSTVDIVTKGEPKGYYSDPVDERGDPTVTKTRGQSWWKLQIDRSITPHAFESIQEFERQVEEKGGKLVLSLPWIYGSTEARNIKSIKRTAYYLSQIAPTIYDEENYNVQDNLDYFADTHYHLVPEGRKVRSQQLAKELKNVLGN